MTSEALAHIKGTARLSLVSKKPDHYKRLTFDWTHRLTGSVMPCSPLVDAYTIDYTFMPYYKADNKRVDVRAVTYKAEIKWAKHVAKLYKMLPQYQLTHRSRTIALAASPLMKNELDVRLGKVKAAWSEYPKLKCTESEGQQLFDIVIDGTLKAMKLNWDYIVHYIRDHLLSSLGGGGFKWRDALTIDRQGWKEVFEIVKSNLELMKSNPKTYVANVPQTGLRARSLDIAADILASIMSEIGKITDALVDRTRIITFGNFMSLYTLFIPDKASWYGKILEAVCDVIKPEGEYYFPLIMGGKIYKLVSQLHN